MTGVTVPFNVSRETLNDLQSFEVLLNKWNKKINLVSKGTLSDFQSRHIVDSSQTLLYILPNAERWLDIGSGAGLPGLVVAILAKDHFPDLKVEMVESDQRKSAFLRTMVRELKLNATISTERIETANPRNADVVSARAVAPLKTLLLYVQQHMNKNGEAIFHKGKNWQKEVHDAYEHWQFDVETHKSLVDDQSVILKIRNVRHV